MPGMANAHNHLIQIAFRGYNDDRWPVLDIPAAVAVLLEQLHGLTGRIDAERAYVLTRLHMLDMLKAGYTATHDEHRSEEHTSELQSLMRISYAVFCLKKKT